MVQGDDSRMSRLRQDRLLLFLRAGMTRGSSLYIFATVSSRGRPEPLRWPPWVSFGFVSFT